MKKKYPIIYLLIFMSSFCFSQQKRLDGLISNIKTAKDSVIVEEAIEIINELWDQEKYQTVLKYCDTVSKLSIKIDYHNGTGFIYKLTGHTYNRLNYSVKALKNYDIAENYYKKINNQSEIASLNNGKSVAEQNRGNLEKSANYLLDATLYYEKNKDSLSLITIYNNLGNLYKQLDKFNVSFKYFTKSIATIKNTKSNPKRLGLPLGNLALLYLSHKKTDSAKILLQEVLEIGKKHNVNSDIAFAQSALGHISLNNKEYQKSKKQYLEAYNAYKKINDQISLIETSQNLAFIATKLKEYKKADSVLIKTRAESIELNVPFLILSNYKYTATLDSARGNFQKAFEWQKKYQELSDETKLEESSKKIEQTEARYKSEMKQLKLIDEQKSKAKKAKEELLKYRIITFISLGILFVILIFMHFIIKTRKERRKYVKQLAESNQVKNKLFSIISHDLKNEIHGLEGSLNLMKDNTISTEEFKEIVPLLANRTQQTSILLNNLLNWSKSQLKELHAKPDTFNIIDIIKDKFNFFKAKALQKNIKLINKLDPTIVFADKDMFAIVSQNLIANAIKFCNPGDSITLFSKEKEDHYEICFEDTGVGIAPDNLDKLFAEDTFTTNGTQQETGTGLGLRICKELIEINKGKINVKSKLNVGSTFYIYLPKAQLI